MRKVILLYNPVAGRRRTDRVQLVEAAAAALRAHGVDAHAVATHGPGTAGRQACEAIGAGCDTVIACGGDGTVHEVAQGVVGTPAALGLLPLGTANALAADLGIVRSPVAAARQLLEFEPRPVAAGLMQYTKDGERISRYFLVAAGVGADADLMYQLDPTLKMRFGMAAYYAQASWIWATHRLPVFEAEIEEAGGVRRELVTQVLAVRVETFGGILRRLAPGANLSRDDLRLVLFKTPSRARYLAFVLRAILDRPWTVPGIELVDANAVTCRAVAQGSQIYAEADGELLGGVPVVMRPVPAALNLLMPKLPRPKFRG